jgi:hypothetical protein
MKRILLSVFAAAITAAVAVPAIAADVDLSGQYRARGEYVGNPSFVQADGTNSVGQRVRLTADAQATDDTSVKITIQDTRTWGTNDLSALSGTVAGGPGLTNASGGNNLDLHESFVNINNVLGTPLALKVGRQELNYGDQRLIGSFGWHNNGRSFDAIKLTYKSDAANVDLFDAKINDNTTGDTDQDLLGAYVTVNTIPNNSLDLYVLHLTDGSTAPIVINNQGALTPDERQSLTTLGARLKGNFDAVDYTGELAYQTGTLNTATTDYDIKGLAYAVKGGYTLPSPQKIRLGAEYVYASGDDSTTDTELSTFSNLFPTNHGHMGFMDQQGWRNVSAWSVNAKASGLVENLELFAQYWSFSQAEQLDNWYKAGNWMNAGTTTGSSTRDGLGSELDITAKYKLNASTSVYAGISRYFAGDVIDDINGATPTEDRDWAFLQLTTNF